MPSEHCRAVVDTCDLSDKDKDKDNGIESDLVIYIYSWLFLTYWETWTLTWTAFAILAMFLLHKKRSALLISVYIFNRQIVDSRSGANQNTALKSVGVILTLMLEAWYSFAFRKKREAFTCSAQRLTQFDESVHVFVSRRVRTFLYNSFSNQLLSLAAGRRVLPSRWVSEAQTFHTFSNISSFFISEKDN